MVEFMHATKLKMSLTIANLYKKCFTCLSDGRHLQPLQETMLLNTLCPQIKFDPWESGIIYLICWECTAIINKIKKFQAKVLTAHNAQYTKTASSLSGLKIKAGPILTIALPTHLSSETSSTAVGSDFSQTPPAYPASTVAPLSNTRRTPNETLILSPKTTVKTLLIPPICLGKTSKPIRILHTSPQDIVPTTISTWKRKPDQPKAQTTITATTLKIADSAKLADATKIADAAKIAESTKIANPAKIPDATKIADAAKLTDATKIEDAEKIADTTKIADATKIPDAAKIPDATKIADVTKIADAAKIADATKIADTAELADATKIAGDATKIAVDPIKIRLFPFKTEIKEENDDVVESTMDFDSNSLPTTIKQVGNETELTDTFREKDQPDLLITNKNIKKEKEEKDYFVPVKLIKIEPNEPVPSVSNDLLVERTFETLPKMNLKQKISNTPFKHSKLRGFKETPSYCIPSKATHTIPTSN